MKFEFISKIDRQADDKSIDKFKDIVGKKLDKMSRYFDENAKIKVMLKSLRDDYFVLEVTIFVDGSNIMRGEDKSKDMFSTIDLVIPKLERQIRKYKTKLGKKIKDDIPSDMFIAEDSGKESEVKFAELARVKKVDLRKISVKDAIEEMELFDHDFYVFINADNGFVNVIYKRHDGNVGLLDLIY